MIEILILLHNRDQIYVPKMDEIYGSELIVLDLTPEMRKAGTTAVKNYNLKRTHVKSLDNPTRRCDSNGSKANVTQCITRYLEQMIGCSMGLLRSDRQDSR